MASEAYGTLDGRMKDIEQLLDAHKALTQFRRARQAAEAASGRLAQISEVIEKLVREPGRGRPTEVDALNRAAMVLLSAHLQGYIEDVYADAARILLEGKVSDIDALIEQAQSHFPNPHAHRIDDLFASIGLPTIMDGLRWRKASNQAIRKRLTEYIRTRNAIAHGTQEPVTKRKVVGFKRFVQLFASNFDEKVANDIQPIIGQEPW